MSIVFNGVTIPEDTANALAFDGVDITKVIFNGVEVWKQVLLPTAWSNSSIGSGPKSWAGFQVSGSQARAYAKTTSLDPATSYGIWVGINSSGFDGNSSARAGSSVIMYSFTSDNFKWNTASYGMSGTSTYDITSKSWTGTQTSSGKIRGYSRDGSGSVYYGTFSGLT